MLKRPGIAAKLPCSSLLLILDVIDVSGNLHFFLFMG